MCNVILTFDDVQPLLRCVTFFFAEILPIFTIIDMATVLHSLDRTTIAIPDGSLLRQALCTVIYLLYIYVH